MTRSSHMIYKGYASRPLVDEIIKRSDQNLLSCYQCRRCAAGCPVGEESGVTPDRLIRMILLGDQDAALNNLLVSKCVACYTCGVRCPNSIQSARITETLKQMAKEAHRQPLNHRMTDFYDAFLASVRHWGRFNEIEGMAIYETENVAKEVFKGRFRSVIDELFNQAQLGVALIKKKRMHIGLDRVSRRTEIKSLFEKTKKR
jgi:heterodisulfide reductase subunit C2